MKKLLLKLMVLVFCAQIQWAQSSSLAEHLPSPMALASSAVDVHSLDGHHAQDNAPTHNCQDCIQHCHMPIGLLSLATSAVQTSIELLPPLHYLVSISQEHLTDIERPQWIATTA